MAFELARMFPAYKPSEIPALPTKLYLKMIEFYMAVKRAEARPRTASDPDLEVPGFNVIDFDKNMAEGKPV